MYKTNCWRACLSARPTETRHRWPSGSPNRILPFLTDEKKPSLTVDNAPKLKTSVASHFQRSHRSLSRNFPRSAVMLLMILAPGTSSLRHLAAESTSRKTHLVRLTCGLIVQRPATWNATTAREVRIVRPAVGLWCLKQNSEQFWGQFSISRSGMTKNCTYVIIFALIKLYTTE